MLNVLDRDAFIKRVLCTEVLLFFRYLSCTRQVNSEMDAEITRNADNATFVQQVFCNGVYKVLSELLIALLLKFCQIQLRECEGCLTWCA